MSVAHRQFLLVILSVLLTGFPAQAQTARTILKTGDNVPGFGAVGNGAFRLVAIANDGRLLVGGSQGIFWAADHQLQPIFTSQQTGGATTNFYAANARSNGATLLPANVPGQEPFLYLFLPGEGPTTLRTPDSDGRGAAPCSANVNGARVSTRGLVAIPLWLSTPGHPCFSDDEPQEEGFYLSDGDGPGRIVRASDLPNGSPRDRIQVLAISEEGAVVVLARYAASDQAVAMALRPDGRIIRLVGSGDPAPSGQTLDAFLPLAVNDLGEVAFLGVIDDTRGLYRTAAGSIVEVAVPVLAPTGNRFHEFPGGIGFNRSGDIVAAPVWSEQYPERGEISATGVILYPASGGSQVLFRGGLAAERNEYASARDDVSINDAGVVAFTVSGNNTGLRALVTQGADVRVELAGGDVGDDGAILARDGIDAAATSMCLAPDGRVAVVATSVSGHRGLICIDGEGPHLIVQSGTTAPNGYDFTDFYQCSFTGDGGLTFGGYFVQPRNNQGYVESSVYKAGAAGIEKLLGDGDLLTNGKAIRDSGSTTAFSANAKGSVLASVSLDPGSGLVLAHSGLIEPISKGGPLVLDDADQVGSFARLEEVTPDHETGIQGDAFLLWKEGRLRIAARSQTLPGGPYPGFIGLRARADLFLLSTSERDFFLRGDGSSPWPLAAHIPNQRLLDFTSAGRILERTEEGLSVIGPTGATERTIRITTDERGVSLNDRGNVLLFAYAPPHDVRQRVELVGPKLQAAARCPVLQTQPPPSPTRTALPTAISDVGPYRVYVTEGSSDSVAALHPDTLDLLGHVNVAHRVRDLAVAPDGARIFVLSEASVDIVEAQSLRVVRRVPLFDYGRNIFAAEDNRHAFVSVPANALGRPRLIAIDGDLGTLSSTLDIVGTVFAVDESGGYAYSINTTGGPCNSSSELIKTDLATSQIIARTAAGVSATKGVIGADGTRAYVTDACRNEVLVIDLATVRVVEALPTEQSPFDIALAASGDRVLTTHQHFTLATTDLNTDERQTLAIAGSGRGRVAVAPDGRIYVTGDVPGLSLVAAVDERTNRQIALTLANGLAGAIAIGLAPPAGLPTPGASGVSLQVHSVKGLATDQIPIVVTLTSNGSQVRSVELDLISAHFARTALTGPLNADCQIGAGVEARANFTLTAPAGLPYEQVHVAIESSVAAPLPDAVPLFVCTTTYYGGPWSIPIVVSAVDAHALDGSSLSATGIDGQIEIVGNDEATPRPTRAITLTPTPTSTPISTSTPTSMPALTVTATVPAATAAPSASPTGTPTIALPTTARSMTPSVASPTATGSPTTSPTLASGSGGGCALSPQDQDPVAAQLLVILFAFAGMCKPRKLCVRGSTFPLS